MEALKAKGLEIYAAYGNTTTDIRAYAAAGIPKVTPTAQVLRQIRLESTDRLPACLRVYKPETGTLKSGCHPLWAART